MPPFTAWVIPVVEVGAVAEGVAGLQEICGMQERGSKSKCLNAQGRSTQNLSKVQNVWIFLLTFAYLPPDSWW